MSEDAELLRRYAEDDADAAFAAFVQRHLDFVYGCALRRLAGDTHLAADVAQQVFVAAARDARRLARHPVIAAWLFTTTRNAAVQTARAERRRRDREQTAHAMNELNSEPAAAAEWTRLRPVLDDALDSLAENERRAVLLRFFENRSFAEIGGQLHIAENAARMRVTRALEKLSGALRRRGVDSTAAALAIALAKAPAIAAPTGLAATATSAALAAAATHVAAAGTLFMGLTKMQVAVTGALLLGGTVAVVNHVREAVALRTEAQQLENALARPRPAASVRAQTTTAAPATATFMDLKALSHEANALDREAAVLREKIRNAEWTLQKNSAAAARPFVGAYSGPVMEETAVDVRPKAVSKMPPKYPFYMRRLRLDGEAVIDCTVDPTGTVRDARVEQANPVEAGEAALAAVAQWRYQPAQKDGNAVAVHVRVPIHFVMQKESPPPGDPNWVPPAPWF